MTPPRLVALRLVAPVLVVALAAGCTASPNDPADELRRATSSPPQSLTEVTDTLTAAGIGVVDRVTDPLPDAVVTVTSHQLTSMAKEIRAGAGILGADLDAVLPQTEGAPPFSYWLAAWISDPLTARAELAATWYPEDTEWIQAPSLRYPRAALLMFATDVAEDADEHLPPLDPDERFAIAAASAPAALSMALAAPARPGSSITPVALAAGPVGSICTAIDTFFSVQLTNLFNHLRLRPDFAGGGVLGFIGGLIPRLWNLVVSLAESALRGLVKNLTAPILEVIGQAIAIAGVVSHLSTYLSGWQIDVTAHPELNAFAVGDAPDRTGLFRAAPGPDHRPWQPDLEACAKTLGIRLPELLQPGSPVQWTVDVNQGGPAPGPVIHERSRDDRVPASGKPELRYVTGREASARGQRVHGVAQVSARASRAELEKVLSFARGRIDSIVASIVSTALPVPELAEPVKAELQRLLRPALDQAEAAIRGGTSSVLEMSSFAFVYVSYHREEEESEEPSMPAEPVVDEFCRGYEDLLRWASSAPNAGTSAWAKEVVRRFALLRSIAPRGLGASVDVHIAVYSAAAEEPIDPALLGELTEDLPAASEALANHCGIDPSRYGLGP